MSMAGQHNVHNKWIPARIPQRCRVVNGIDVWLIDLCATDLQNSAFLSSQERKRSRAFVHPHRRQAYIASHVALRRLLAAYCARPVQELVFQQGPYGKPELINADRLYFNLSHSKERALIAISDCAEVGADVESFGDQTPVDIIAQTFSKREQDILVSVCDDLHTDVFFEGWCRKEAALKAEGTGLTDDLTDMDVLNVKVCRTGEKAGSHPKNWFFYPLPKIAGYGRALAASIADLDLRTWLCVP